VGFSNTTPILAPAPPFYVFKNPERKEDASVIIHVADIVAWFINEDELKRRWDEYSQSVD
jgi:hypothetical protein